MPISGLLASGMQTQLDDVNDRRLQEFVRQLKEREQADQLKLQQDTLASAEKDRAAQRENTARTINLAELKRTDDLGREATQRNGASDMAGVLAMPGMSNEAKASEIMGSGLRTGQVDPARVIEGLTRVPAKKEYTYTDPKTGNKSLRAYDPSSVPSGGLDMGNEPQKPERGPAPEYEWITRNGNPMQIRKGSAQAGDRPYEKAAANGPDPAKAAETRTKILDAAKALKTAKGLSSLTGNRIGNSDYNMGLSDEPRAGSSAANAAPLFKTLKSLMTLENLGLLKGAMSDKDLAFIQSAGSSLDTSMDDPTFIAELDKIIQKFENVPEQTGGGGGSLTNLVYDPKTKTFHPKGS